MEPQQIVFLAILATALALFVSGRMRVDVVAMLTLLALTFTGILDARQAQDQAFGFELDFGHSHDRTSAHASNVIAFPHAREGRSRNIRTR